MKHRAAWIAGLVAGTLVWTASPELRWPARLLTALLLGPAPVAFVLQARAIGALPRPIPRIPVYIGSIAGLWLLGTLALAAALLSDFTPGSLGLAAIAPGAFVVWTLASVLATGAVVAVFKAGGLRESDIMSEITPVTGREKAVFAVLSVSAGVCEEIAFRGFLIVALSAATGSLAASVVLSSLAFGILHAHQHAGGALRAAILGVILAIPLVVTGSLLAPIAAHVLIDLVGGLWLARWLLR
ncbi:MAG: CPBP family intramembrane glutamic endopeptidase [Gemmatimonadota bacterium]